jgi:hypothetical protein
MPHIRVFSCAAVRETPSAAGLLVLPRSAERHGVRRDVIGDNTACGDERTVAERHWRHQDRVGAHEHVAADHRAVFGKSIVIAGDGAGANVRSLADFRVAEVGEVIGLRTFAEERRLQLDEISDMGVAADDGAGPEPREWADDRAFADRASFQVRVGANFGVAFDGDAGSEHHVGADRHIG